MIFECERCHARSVMDDSYRDKVLVCPQCNGICKGVESEAEGVSRVCEVCGLAAAPGVEVCPACGGRIVAQAEHSHEEAAVEAPNSDQKRLDEGLGGMALIPWISLIGTIAFYGREVFLHRDRLSMPGTADGDLFAWLGSAYEVLLIGLLFWAGLLLVYGVVFKQSWIQKLRKFYLAMGWVNVGFYLLVFGLAFLEPKLIDTISMSGFVGSCFWPFVWAWVLKRIRAQA